jgi:hypothetical protein
MDADRTEKRIRFGCGFTAGLVIGFSVALRWCAKTWGGLAAIIVASAMVCGWLAVRYAPSWASSP